MKIETDLKVNSTDSDKRIRNIELETKKVHDDALIKIS